MKTCSKCQREFPATAVYFYRHKNMKDGLNTVCKECDGFRFKEPRKTHIATLDGYKVCTKCKRELPETLEYFFKRKSGKNGLMSVCKECHGHTFMKKITYNDKDKKCAECGETYPYTNEHFHRTSRTKSGLMNYCKKCANKLGKRHYVLNKEKIDLKHREYYEENKETICKRTKKYQKENSDRYKVIWERRRAKKKQLANSFSFEEWEYCKSHFNNCCAYCGLERKLEQDHFIPLSLDGEYTKKNIVPACKRCNSSKQNRLFSEWYPKRKFYDKQRENTILKYLGYLDGIQQTALL